MSLLICLTVANLVSFLLFNALARPFPLYGCSPQSTMLSNPIGVFLVRYDFYTSLARNEKLRNSVLFNRVWPHNLEPVCRLRSCRTIKGLVVVLLVGVRIWIQKFRVFFSAWSLIRSSLFRCASLLDSQDLATIERGSIIFA